ncbi:LPXTG cell wall anchor domain-containing protein [Streptococcus orisratti]|uniref:LPXTG cell wall anchor domain-containing protein n=1 Tax=Streptococcus orisratti TaxID=114652 RepID=UPI003D094D96
MAPNTKKVYAFRKGKKALVSVAIATLFAAGSLAVSNGVIVHADDVASTVTSSELEAAEKEYNEASKAYQVAQVESTFANESLEEENLVVQIQSAQEEIDRANEIVDSVAKKLSDDTDAVVDANTTVENAQNERDQAQKTLDQAQESHASAEELVAIAINESKEKIESLEAQDEAIYNDICNLSFQSVSTGYEFGYDSEEYQVIENQINTLEEERNQISQDIHTHEELINKNYDSLNSTLALVDSAKKVLEEKEQVLSEAEKELDAAKKVQEGTQERLSAAQNSLQSAIDKKDLLEQELKDLQEKNAHIKNAANEKLMQAEERLRKAEEKLEQLRGQGSKNEGYGEVVKTIVTVTDTPEFDVTKTIGTQENQDEGLRYDEDGDPIDYYVPSYYFETDDSNYPTLTDEDLKGSYFVGAGGSGFDSDIDPFKDRNQNEKIVDSNRKIKYVNYTDLYGNSYSEQIVYYVPRYNHEKVFSVSETNHYLFSSQEYSLAFHDGKFVGGISDVSENIFISKDQGDTTNKTLEQYKDNFSRVYYYTDLYEKVTIANVQYFDEYTKDGKHIIKEVMPTPTESESKPTKVEDSKTNDVSTPDKSVEPESTVEPVKSAEKPATEGTPTNGGTEKTSNQEDETPVNEEAPGDSAKDQEPSTDVTSNGEEVKETPIEEVNVPVKEVETPEKTEEVEVPTTENNSNGEEVKETPTEEVTVPVKEDETPEKTEEVETPTTENNSNGEEVKGTPTEEVNVPVKEVETPEKTEEVETPTTENNSNGEEVKETPTKEEVAETPSDDEDSSKETPSENKPDTEVKPGSVVKPTKTIRLYVFGSGLVEVNEDSMLNSDGTVYGFYKISDNLYSELNKGRYFDPDDNRYKTVDKSPFIVYPGEVPPLSTVGKFVASYRNGEKEAGILLQDFDEESKKYIIAYANGEALYDEGLNAFFYKKDFNQNPDGTYTHKDREKESTIDPVSPSEEPVVEVPATTETTTEEVTVPVKEDETPEKTEEVETPTTENNSNGEEVKETPTKEEVAETPSEDEDSSKETSSENKPDTEVKPGSVVKPTSEKPQSDDTKVPAKPEATGTKNVTKADIKAGLNRVVTKAETAKVLDRRGSKNYQAPNTLPATGEASAASFVLAGALVASFGFVGLKKRKN